VSDHQADYPIASMCRLLGVSSSGYYAWMKRRPSRRAETDAALIGEIRAAHAASLGAYGAPRIHAELTAKGMQQCWSVVHWGLCWGAWFVELRGAASHSVPARPSELNQRTKRTEPTPTR
jgi:hypothetical protein